MLEASLGENGIRLGADSIATMVDKTFETADANRDGFIDFEEYRNMCIKQPGILKPLKLNVSEIIAEARAAAATAS